MSSVLSRAKGQVIGADARRAREEGHTIFTPMLRGSLNSDISGPVSGWAEQIESIEAEGWLLLTMSIVILDKNRPTAYPVFRLKARANVNNLGIV